MTSNLPAEPIKRRGFLKWVSGIAAGIMAALVAVPAVTAFLSPALRKPPTKAWLKVVDDVATLDVGNRNRGMAFDKEQTRFCGQRHVVHSRVDRIIDEATGKLVELPNACIILEGVACRAHYSALRIACPRAIYSYWRDCWLKRIGPEPS